MADSRQLDILKRLTAHLEGISFDNGYEFDLAGRVFRGRMVYGADDPVPMLSILEHLQPDIQLSFAGHNNIARQETWVLLIQGWVENQPDNPTDLAYQLKASVEKRLSELIVMGVDGYPVFPDAYLLGTEQTITGIAVGPGVVSGPREISAMAFFYLPLGIGLAMDISDPFVGV